MHTLHAKEQNACQVERLFLNIQKFLETLSIKLAVFPRHLVRLLCECPTFVRNASSRGAATGHCIEISLLAEKTLFPFKKCISNYVLSALHNRCGPEVMLTDNSRTNVNSLCSRSASAISITANHKSGAVASNDLK